MSTRSELRRALSALRLEVPASVHADFSARLEAVLSEHEQERETYRSLLPLARSVLAGCAPDTPEARALGLALDEAEALLS
jgi:hypothetical protein